MIAKPDSAVDPSVITLAAWPGVGTSLDRLPQLDSLRGIAAAVVVLHHALLCLLGEAMPGGVEGVLGAILFLGRPAVVLFFVLSGFVLTLHLTGRSESVAFFMLRRALRLLPPYWVATLGAYGLFSLVRGGHGAALSPWIAEQWGAPITFGDLLAHLAMRAGPRQFPLDHVAWSLVHELRLSLIVPLMAVGVRHWGSTATLLAGTCISLAAEAVVAFRPEAFPVGIHGFRFDAPDLGASLVLTSRFALDFALGAVLALNRARAIRALRRWPWARPIALLAGLALMSQGGEAVTAIGAALLIAVAIAWPRLARRLEAWPAAWLGRVSYSLYLVHLPVMFACGSVLVGIAPPWVGVLLGVVLSLPCAEVLYRLIEAPSIRWARAAGRASVFDTVPSTIHTLLREIVSATRRACTAAVATLQAARSAVLACAGHRRRAWLYAGATALVWVSLVALERTSPSVWGGPYREPAVARGSVLAVTPAADRGAPAEPLVADGESIKRLGSSGQMADPQARWAGALSANWPLEGSSTPATAVKAPARSTAADGPPDTTAPIIKGEREMRATVTRPALQLSRARARRDAGHKP